MTPQPTNDPVLRRYRAVLGAIYGDQLERVVLFGSRARGDARPDSDYDVAVFLKSMPDRWAELDRLADLRVRFLDDADAFFDAKPYAATAWLERTPLMREIRRDGVPV
jgi:predicted nucleotidyltransferase